MMKQPVDNPNATAEEIRKAEERKRPLPQNAPEDRELADTLARRLAADQNAPDEEARRLAEELLRNKKNMEAKP
jgi:hypothetical protein